MSATQLAPTQDDARTAAAFESLMWALARPGSVQALAAPGLSMLAASLIDRECRFFGEDAALARQLAFAGGHPVALPEAEYIFTSLAGRAQVGALAKASVGSLLYPDASATIFSIARIGSGTKLSLKGPGIDGTQHLMVDAVHPSFWQLRSQTNRYPLGWDLFLVDGDRLVGIPRSTTVEVL